MFLTAQVPAEGAGGVAGLIGALAPFILMIIMVYFMIIRPQRKRDKENKEMLASLNPRSVSTALPRFTLRKYLTVSPRK
jgi:hypothetical protein